MSSPAVPMAFGDADLDMMTSDVFSVAVTYGAQSCRGILDSTDEIVGGVEGTAFSLRNTTVLIQTGDLTSVQEDTAITVDGTAYQVRDVAIRDDGKITAITLAPP